MDKVGMSPMVGTVLLVTVSVTAVFFFNSWFGEFESTVLSDLEVDSNEASSGGLLSVDDLIGGELYIVNNLGINTTVNSLRIDGTICNESFNLTSGMNVVDVRHCLGDVDGSSPEVVLITEDQIVEKELYVPVDELAAVATSPVSCVATGLYDFNGGSGTVIDPWQICNCTQLQNMSADLSGNYVLVKNIDCDVAPFNVGLGFEPIGTFGSEFAGVIDGAGFSVLGLYINRPATSYVGLLGEVTSDVEIKNINFVNVDVTGDFYVGSLVGYGSAKIDNVYISGSVSGSSSVGGLVGSS